MSAKNAEKREKRMKIIRNFLSHLLLYKKRMSLKSEREYPVQMWLKCTLHFHFHYIINCIQFHCMKMFVVVCVRACAVFFPREDFGLDKRYAIPHIHVYNS